MNNDNSVSLTAVGDVLPHGRVYGGTKKKSDYKFGEKLENAAHLLGKTDITVANLETIIAGKDIGLTSYPRFNCPVELGYTLKDMGVDIVSIANNHMLDRGEEGLLKSISNLKEIGLEYDGGYKSFEDRDRLRIIKKNGLRICFVSFTRGTNSIEIPEDKPYLSNSLKEINPLKIYSTLRRIKKNKLADVIVANMHFGEEYHLYPSSTQREMSASLADAGADVILGHHPHVLQPPEWIETSRGTKSFAAYSMGNFFTGQNGLHRQIGAVLSLDITKPRENYTGIEIKNPKYELTFVSNERHRNYKIHVFRDWIKENKEIKTAEFVFDSNQVYEDVVNRMRKEIKSLEIN
ncbi:CapA family protein [Lentibacillus amyloliquefaciens]|uniref:Poly-gamma-glutamate biosynthesis protein n=1 Tax=Lentibacillus amyloliquefaciens TaxID=1472767 RepID=A0A0U4EHK1_9BACI|nr:CapA family protein [Lentibacillus amyloliquefaciens]ALX49945.1 poly-gamma-glutamate biosynthesis protein [Lentibacillus amyloliquefaciens]